MRRVITTAAEEKEDIIANCMEVKKDVKAGGWLDALAHMAWSKMKENRTSGFSSQLQSISGEAQNLLKTYGDSIQLKRCI